MKHFILTGSLILSAFHFCTAQSWKRVTEIPRESVYCFEVHDHIAYAGTADRVYIGASDGAEWRPTTAFGSKVYVFAVTSYHHKLYAGTSRGGVLVSADDGASWQPLSNGLIVPSISSFSIWRDTLYAGSLGDGFYKLDEPGGRWIPFNPDFYTNVDGNVYQLLAIDSTLIAAAGANGIFYKYDSAAGSWDFSYYLSRLAPGLNMYGLLFDSAKTLYAGSGSRVTVLSSLDRGRSWLVDNNGLHTGDPVLAADDKYDYTAVSFLDNSGIPSVRAYQRPILAPAGTAWTLTDSLPQTYFYGLGVAGSHLYSARDSGLYYKGAAVMPPMDTAEKPFIYPNPASAQVHIALHFQESQTISVQIYDAGGKRVATPLTGYPLAAGRQIVTVDIQGLSDGIYIIDVSTPQKHHTGRLMVRH